MFLDAAGIAEHAPVVTLRRHESTAAARVVSTSAAERRRLDGVGGADPARGTGLQGLADRVNALGGSVHVSSPPGHGTTVRAEIPCPPR